MTVEPLPTETDGRVAIVTGASQGIGYQTAFQLAKSKKFKHVVLACMEDDKGRKACSDIQTDLPYGVDVQIHYVNLTVGDVKSHKAFVKNMELMFGKVDLLINNAAISFRVRDETPIKEQCKQTLNVNFRGTCELTERLLPLIRKGEDPRIVFVTSILGRVNQLGKENRKKLSDPEITIPQLRKIYKKYESDVIKDKNKKKYFDNIYGMAAVAVNVAMRIYARQEGENGIAINAVCPGYCRTAMTGWEGPRTAAEGAKNVLEPALMENPPSGEFFSSDTVKNFVFLQ